MEKFVIHGGKPLHGEVTISGAKNAAVAILPATILAADKCVIENLPDISDVAVSLQILSSLGAQIRMLDRNTRSADPVTSLFCQAAGLTQSLPINVVLCIRYSMSLCDAVTEEICLDSLQIHDLILLLYIPCS